MSFYFPSALEDLKTSDIKFLDLLTNVDLNPTIILTSEERN